jgi:hypothetical protein
MKWTDGREMSNQITNHKDWRRLDWASLIFFGISALGASVTLSTKVGKEDWTNWAWLAITLFVVVRSWERLFGKRDAL